MSVKSELKDGVDHVMANGGAFAAVKHDGSVVTWSHPHFRGDSGVCVV